MSLLVKLLQTNNRDYTNLILRIALGGVVLPHGAQKLLGWFGGAGFAGTMDFFTQMMGLPALFAFLVIMVESFGAVALIFGFLGRLTALGIALIMLGAIAMVHAPMGFFMDWFNTLEGEGFEYHLLALGLALPLILKGSGLASLDVWLQQKLFAKNQKEAASLTQPAAS